MLVMKKYSKVYPRVIDGEWESRKYAKAYVLLADQLMLNEKKEKYELCCILRDAMKNFQNDSFFLDGTIKQRSKETLYELTKSLGRIDLIQWDNTRERAAITIDFYGTQYNFFVNYEEYISMGGDYHR